MYFRAQKKTMTEVSLNETIDVDRDGNPLTYIDVISSDDDIAEIVDRKLKTAKMFSYVHTLLSERERQIVILRLEIQRRTRRGRLPHFWVFRAPTFPELKNALWKN